MPRERSRPGRSASLTTDAASVLDRGLAAIAATSAHAFAPGGTGRHHLQGKRSMIHVWKAA